MDEREKHSVVCADCNRPGQRSKNYQPFNNALFLHGYFDAHHDSRGRTAARTWDIYIYIFIYMAVIDFHHNPFFFQYSGAVKTHHLSLYMFFFPFPGFLSHRLISNPAVELSFSSRRCTYYKFARSFSYTTLYLIELV